MYTISIHIFSLFNKKAKAWIKGRDNLLNTIKKEVGSSKQIVWFHCASLGEFNQAKPIIKKYKSKNLKHKILLPFFSPSGFEAQKNTDLANWVFYLPADTKSNAKKFIAIINPIKVIFIKYEFWFNYMHELHNKNIPLYIVSTIFRDEQSFFKYKWFAKQLKHITHFFVQDKKSGLLLKKIGLNNYTVSGDTRFDSVIDNQQNSLKIPLVKKFCKDKYTIIGGSTWPKDEILLIKYIKAHPQMNYIIAPHELNNISNLQKKTNALLYSNANKKNILTTNVLIIDNIGILFDIYKYANLAYIGGGFGTGIHNVLEAVTFGLPVIFGPNYQKHNEAICLIKEGGAISISNYKELDSAIESLNTFNKSIAFNYIKKNAGATKKIFIP